MPSCGHTSLVALSKTSIVPPRAIPYAIKHMQKSPRSPWLYAALLVFFAYLYVQILEFTTDNSHNLLLIGLYFIEFGVHEASHMITAFLPPIITAAAGSIGEVSFTTLIAYAGFRAKSYFAGIFGLLWVTLAMNNAGRYMADARSQQLDLIGLSDHPIHDWHFVFGQLGWLQADTAIGGTVRILGDLIGAAGLLLGCFLVIVLFTTRRKSIDSPKK